MSAAVVWRREPWMDAEAAAHDWRPVIGECDICGCDIHGADGVYESDEAFAFEDGGDVVCSDCLYKYCREHFRI